MSRPRTSRRPDSGRSSSDWSPKRDRAGDGGAARQQAGQRHGGDALAAAGLADQCEHLPLGHLERRPRRRRAPGRPRCGTRRVRSRTVQQGGHRGVSRGSSASRSPSPSRLSAERDDHDADAGEAPPSTDRPGTAAARWRACTPSDGAGGRMPRPRKDSTASPMMAAGCGHGGLDDERVDRVGQDVAAQQRRGRWRRRPPPRRRSPGRAGAGSRRG